jgi:hypothetical protein
MMAANCHASGAHGVEPARHLWIMMNSGWVVRVPLNR